MDKSGSNLLVVVLDMNPMQKYMRADLKQFFNCVDAVIAFCNSHLMLNAMNQVAIIGSHLKDSVFIYPKEIGPAGPKSAVRQQDGQYEVFYELEVIVRDRVKEITKDSNKFITKEGKSSLSSCLANAVGKGLSYINRKEKEITEGRLTSRIFILSGSAESSSQYMAFMNTFFAAQRMNVVIDACVLGPYATLLGQGTDLTGGIYLRPPTIPGLLQYLLWIFLPDPEMRKKMALPPQEPVDYRAACFCHRNLIEQGFVCSACLSIFCKSMPLCTTCKAVFRAPSIVPVAKKKPKA